MSDIDFPSPKGADSELQDFLIQEKQKAQFQAQVIYRILFYCNRNRWISTRYQKYFVSLNHFYINKHVATTLGITVKLEISPSRTKKFRLTLDDFVVFFRYTNLIVSVGTSVLKNLELSWTLGPKHVSQTVWKDSLILHY